MIKKYLSSNVPVAYMTVTLSSTNSTLYKIHDLSSGQFFYIRMNEQICVENDFYLTKSVSVYNKTSDIQNDKKFW